ncbi:Anaerobic selenocysteine-containing dehydrogenase [Marinobacter antarcticus]|uniref:Anaerobic selenocysteine-containing dehydrogenase n=1 Tax=Marinobacter antarcticus TaxID=564117 RepID=A0A1M6P2X9_9GAMM|nr:molybdopterin-dependent oxidoreductase [Marinobacter antarcticus]SHK02264.1 Anaerobic selenocysteine-containing dehydrogenase [Marinobacter antarcticus]
MDNGIHYRTCHLCEAMCGVAVEVKGGRIAAIRGDEKDPLSHGHICPKAVALQDLHEDPERLRKPVRKTSTGWQEIEWDEAFDTVAEKLHDTRTAHGRNSVGVYLGNPNVHNHGSLIATMPFLHAVGTQNRFSATSNDQLPHMLASLEMFGHQVLFPVPDIDNTDLFICIGGNPMASNGSLMTVPDFRGRLKALKQRNGKMIVVDPRRTETAKQAEEFHFIRPGTDAFLLMAMVNTLFMDKLISPGPAEHLIKDLDLLRLSSLPFTPEAVIERTGISAETIRDLTHQLANTPKAALYTRMGTSTQTFGSITTWLAYCLNILTGKLDTVGGVMFTQPAIDLIALGAMAGQRGHFGKRHSRVKGLPEFAGEYPASTMADEILTPGEGQIRAFVTVAGNPVLSSPNGRRLDEALSGLDFMVSVDYYINETTRHADIILPPTAALERSHYDIVFNMLAVRNVSKYSEALFDAGPDSRHDWQILLELAHKLEKLRKGGKLPIRSELGWRAFKQAGPDPIIDLLLRTGPYGTDTGRAREILEPATSLVMGLLPKHHPLRGLAKLSSLNPQWQGLPKGLSLKRLKENPSGIDLGALRPALPNRLFTRDGKINLAPRRYLKDVERLHQQLSAPDSPGELLLIGRRHMRSNNSWMHNSRRLVKGKDRCTLLVHPHDANRLNLEGGGQAEISAGGRKVVLPVEITEDMMPGVVSIPHGWGHDRDGTLQSTASDHAGASINDILSDQDTDPVAGTSVLNGQAVTVKVWQPKQQRISA